MKQFLSNGPHVKVAGDPHAVAVSGKVVPPVHINPILLVCHNLIIMDSAWLIYKYAAELLVQRNVPHTRIFSLSTSPIQ